MCCFKKKKKKKQFLLFFIQYRVKNIIVVDEIEEMIEIEKKMIKNQQNRKVRNNYNLMKYN